jgi:hypothetical protein
MNLIEQQSAAKDLPMQYLQQAVNGQNPNLTPWIATAELQRRTTMNQHMAPQGPQGPQPTVKDQVEQKAGLMATQQAQQAQAAQAQQSAAPPGPVPGGIPQPEPQPEQPVMAARGGLMNAPVNFKFAHGGILGYADGGETANTNTPETYVDENGVRRFTATNQPAQVAQNSQQPRVQGVRETAEKYATTPVKERSLQDAMDEEQALSKRYNLDQPMGVEERDIIAQRNAAREVARSREGGDAFSAYVSGLIGVPGAAGEQYRRALRDQATAEREHLSGNLKDIKDLNTAQRAAQEKRAGIAGSSRAAGQLASAEEAKNRAGIADRLLGTDAQLAAEKMRDLTSRYNNEATIKMHKDIAELDRRMRESQYRRTSDKDASDRLHKLYGDLVKDEALALSEFNKAPAAGASADDIAELKTNLANIRAAKKPAMAALGLKAGLPAAAPAPASTMAPDRAAQFKVLRPS